jgi:hypothetical protein
MRPDVNCDDKLKDAAAQEPVLKPAGEAAEHSIPILFQFCQQLEIRKFRGKLQWQGDLDRMRTGR